jgi:hypothetical protein
MAQKYLHNKNTSFAIAAFLLSWLIPKVLDKYAVSSPIVDNLITYGGIVLGIGFLIKGLRSDKEIVDIKTNDLLHKNIFTIYSKLCELVDDFRKDELDNIRVKETKKNCMKLAIETNNNKVLLDTRSIISLLEEGCERHGFYHSHSTKSSVFNMAADIDKDNYLRMLKIKLELFIKDVK